MALTWLLPGSLSRDGVGGFTACHGPLEGPAVWTLLHLQIPASTSRAILRHHGQPLLATPHYKGDILCSDRLPCIVSVWAGDFSEGPIWSQATGLAPQLGPASPSPKPSQPLTLVQPALPTPTPTRSSQPFTQVQPVPPCSSFPPGPLLQTHHSLFTDCPLCV